MSFERLNDIEQELTGQNKTYPVFCVFCARIDSEGKIGTSWGLQTATNQDCAYLIALEIVRHVFRVDGIVACDHNNEELLRSVGIAEQIESYLKYEASDRNDPRRLLEVIHKDIDMQTGDLLTGWNMVGHEYLKSLDPKDFQINSPFNSKLYPHEDTIYKVFE